MKEERKFRSTFSAKLRVGIDLVMRQHKFAAMATIVSFETASFPKAGGNITMISSPRIGARFLPAVWEMREAAPFIARRRTSIGTG